MQDYGLGNKVIPYKNRTIDLDKPVQVYRNLNAKTDDEKFSIRQNGLVVGHTNCLMMVRCHFIVQIGGNWRVRETGRKNVHAYIKGLIAKHGSMGAIATDKRMLPAKVTYDPFRDRNFVCRNITVQPFDLKSAMAVMIRDQVTAAYTNAL